MSSGERELDELFRAYRAVCPDPEPSVGFMPGIWQKIEARSSFWLLFARVGRQATTASALACLVLLLLNLITSKPSECANLRRRAGSRPHCGEDILR